jgi:hypothetical protein
VHIDDTGFLLKLIKNKVKNLKMKKQIFQLLSPLFVGILLILVVSCQKDVMQIQQEKKVNDFAVTTKDVKVKKDMLVFKDQNTFDKVLESLRELSHNESWLREHWKGDKNANTVASRDAYIPSYAVFDIFADVYNFNSLLHAQRLAEEAFLEQGGEPEDFHRSFISDDFLQCVMNPYHEIMIGNLVYRLIDQDNAFVITNGNIELINDIRNAPDPYLFQETGNIQLLNLTIQEDNQYFGALFGGLLNCQADFEIVPFGNNIGISDKSMVMGGITQMSWTITDANNNVFFTRSAQGYIGGPTVYGADYPNNPYPWMINLSITAPIGCGTITKSKPWQGPIGACLNIDFRARRLSGFPDRFRAFHFTPLYSASSGQIENSVISWDFGDGTTVVSTDPNGSVDHEFPSNTNATSFTVKCIVASGSGCIRESIKTITVGGCGINQPDMDKEQRYLSNQRKAYALIWMDKTWFSSSVGAKAYFYKNVWWGWKRELADEMTIKWSDNSKFIKDCSNEVELGFVTVKTSGNQSEIRDDRNRFSGSSNTNVSGRTGTISCVFKIKEDGTNLDPITLNW